MKKILALVLALMMMVPFFACAEEGVSVVGIWDFCGGNVGGVEMSQEEAEAYLALYGGSLQLIFAQDMSVVMAQGNGGALAGVFQQVDETSMAVTFDNNGAELVNAMALTYAEDGTIVMVLSPDGETSIYFYQAE